MIQHVSSCLLWLPWQLSNLRTVITQESLPVSVAVCKILLHLLVLGQWCFHVAVGNQKPFIFNLTSKLDICRNSRSGLPNLTYHQTLRQAAVVRTGRKAGLTRPMPTPIGRSTLAVRTSISSAVAAIRAVRAGIKARVSTVRATQVGSSHGSQEVNLAALSPGSRAGHRRAGVLTLIWGPWMIGTARDVIVTWLWIVGKVNGVCTEVVYCVEDCISAVGSE